MKKTLTIVFATILVFMEIQVQAQSFSAGLTAGVVTSQVDGDGYGGFHQLGWTAGVFGRLPSEGPGAFQMELKYSLYGAHSDAKELELGMNPMSIRLHYIEVPLMYHYCLSGLTINGKTWKRLSLEAGVSADFLAKGTQSADQESQYENTSWLFFSMTANAGAQYNVTERLGFNVRVMYSILPCRINPQVALFSFQHYYNFAIQACVVYAIFPAGK